VARVGTRVHSGLSDGAKRFIATWNDYLAGNGERLTTLREALSNLRPAFAGFDEIIAAARATARSRSTAAFVRVHDRVVQDIQQRAKRLETRVGPVMETTDADRRFVDFVNHNAEAQAIIEKVNASHKKGFLAGLASS
jgi:hypothetical protein